MCECFSLLARLAPTDTASLIESSAFPLEVQVRRENSKAQEDLVMVRKERESLKFKVSQAG